MVLGDFNGAGVQGAAVGMPKGGKRLEGKVLLYTWDLTNYLNITGRQLGEYFGYSVATSDIDGDHRDDLIIGAPLHAEKNSEMKYEVGRVYIVYQEEHVKTHYELFEFVSLCVSTNFRVAFHVKVFSTASIRNRDLGFQ